MHLLYVWGYCNLFSKGSDCSMSNRVETPHKPNPYSTGMSESNIAWKRWEDAPVREIAPGIRCRDLWEGDNDAKAQMLEIDPGARFQGIDVHEPGPEEVFVVSGVFNDGTRDFPAGTFIHHPAGSSHVPQSREGCVLFVFFPEG